MKKTGIEPITKEEGEDLASQIGAIAYVPISSISRENIYVPLELGVAAIVQEQPKKSPKCCTM